MRNHTRYLRFNNIEPEKPVVTRCSNCHQKFIADPRAGERMDDVILRLRSEFARHRCREVDATHSRQS
jgi:hypothetical protein